MLEFLASKGGQFMCGFSLQLSNAGVVGVVAAVAIAVANVESLHVEAVEISGAPPSQPHH